MQRENGNTLITKTEQFSLIRKAHDIHAPIGCPIGEHVTLFINLKNADTPAISHKRTLILASYREPTPDRTIITGAV